MNSDELKGKWNQLKGSAKAQWGKLTDDELAEIEGNQDKLVGKIQEKYGIAREEAEKQVENWRDAA
ncbi:CsbD family protein [Hyphococcus sp.]|uniref:CsbD family protein n=1 Tax=Hyphococcus sp. TaxID=2038636 RepID=UPI0035C752D0